MRTAITSLVVRWRSAGLATRAAVTGAAAVALIATVFTAAVLAVNSLGSASASEGRSSTVIDRATQMGEDFLDLHDGVRGFALTDDRSFLAPFWRGVSRLPGDVQSVRTLVGDNPAQLKLLTALATGSESYILNYAMPFIAHPTLAERDRTRFTIVGQRRMDLLRAQFNELVANERTLAAKRRAIRKSNTSRAELVALIGLVGSTLLLIALVVASIRSVARPVRRLSEAALRLRAGEEVTVAETGSGEVKALAASFNSMASELKRRERILENLSRIDALTGIANRRGFQIELPRALASGTRNSQPTSLLMIDLDFFKAYNDEHGHLAGDTLLRDVTTNWLQELRISDTLARYGGEEFVVILPDCALESAVDIAERLRGVVPHDQSCSIGAACYMEGETPSDFTARADAALMSAKRHGRDRTHAVAVA